MDIDQALERFLLQLRADGRSPHTVGQYRRHIRLFAHWAHEDGTCGDAVEGIDHEDVARFLTSHVATSRPDGKRKRATAMNCLRSSIRGFFGFLHRAGYIPRDPSTVLRRAVCGQAPPRALSDAETRQLMNALAADDSLGARRDHALCHLLSASGIRLTAALSLRVEDVDLERGELDVLAAKGDRHERVFLSAAIRVHLRRFIGTRTSGALFPARSGSKMSRRHAHRRLARWLEKAGIRGKYSPHCLRHTFATRLYRKTRDILLVKEALGHRSIQSTLAYARADEQRLRAALA